ncbi:MAG: CdvA-like protein [Candidatus Bathyarchaeota archaeon]|nr:MAG: CdvA-like protein [Candidatus Bathyarchaeota archaeon]
MISWKYSFEKVSRELELAKKKKQALDDLFSTGKISQSTYDDLNENLTEAIVAIEVRHKTLAEKMTAKITELDQQIKTLEKFLANTEIEYAAGELDEELHERESGALTLGLETTKQQLNVIKEAMADLFPGEAELVSPPPPAETIEEASEETVEMPLESQVEAPVEVPEESEPVSEEVTNEQPVEFPVTEEETTEEVTSEQPTEALLPEAPVEDASTEEESFPSTEESGEETVTDEAAETSENVEISESDENIEPIETEVATEEAPIEEFSSFQSEEETTLEEEETEELH